MRTEFRDLLFFLKCTLVLGPALLFSLPFIVTGQEGGIILKETVATTTEPVATTTSVAETATSTEASASTTTIQHISDESDKSGEEEDVFVESVESVPQAQTPQLSVRKFEKRITVDKKASHSCEAEIFHIDISGRSMATARIMLMRDSNASYEVEIGGLPYGIDVTLDKNSGHRYAQEVSDTYLALTIHNQEGSQKGDFTIPIIYTRNEGTGSSVICQINIINQ